MKLHYRIIALCLIFGHEVSAQNYHISRDRDTITVSGNCTIPVDEFASTDSIYGNKEKGGLGGRGRDLFSEKTLKLNDNPKGVRFKREKERATIVIDFAQIEDTTKLRFYKAEYRMSPISQQWDWFTADAADSLFFSVIVKSNSNFEGAVNGEYSGTSLPGKQTAHNTFEINGIKDTIKTITHDVDELKMKINGFEKGTYGILSLLITLFVGLLMGYFLYRKNRMFLIEQLDCNYDKLKNDVIEELKSKDSIQVIAPQRELQKNKGNKPMMDDEIKRFVIEQIKILQPQNVPPTNPTTGIIAVSEPVISPAKKEKPILNTDDVKYHQDSNSFTLEQTDIKIFRIYSRKGEYYYTIVDDSAVREELIGMLQMFKGCIDYQTIDGVAKRVEPVTDGKLRKDGNKFYVDANNKLVVKFA